MNVTPQTEAYTMAPMAHRLYHCAAKLVLGHKDSEMAPKQGWMGIKLCNLIKLHMRM
jgi:hypothetical protein